MSGGEHCVEFQVPIYIGLGFIAFFFNDLEEKDEAISDKSVYKTAPATPSLLKPLALSRSRPGLHKQRRTKDEQIRTNKDKTKS